MHSTKHWISIFLGLILIIMGVIPLLNQIGVANISFASFIGKLTSIFAYIAAFGGLYLMIDSIHEIGMSPFLGWLTLIIGFIILGWGVLLTLTKWGMILFPLPSVPEFFYYAVFIMEGILLFVAGFID